MQCIQNLMRNMTQFLIYFSVYTGSIPHPIWLGNVQCLNSSTSCLADCETCPSSEYANCDHDVTVECCDHDVTVECCEL